MTTTLPPSTAAAGPFSQSLLDHDGLMTPVLRAAFGALTVSQSQAHMGQHCLQRRSSIHQAATGAKILDAVLNISITSLPAGFSEKLQQEDVLFGQLLIDHALAVRICERSLYASLAGEDLRFGRRAAIYRGDTDELICKVDELLVSEAQLLVLRLAHP